MFTGRDQTLHIPSNVRRCSVLLYGAGGGDSMNSGAGMGGGGGLTLGIMLAP